MFRSLQKKFYKILEHLFLKGCSNYNSATVRRKSRTKHQARTMFRQNNIPCATGQVFFNPVTAFSFVKKHGFPVVLKPNLGGFSRGSFFPITNYTELFRALFLVKFYWPKTVIETYLEGKNYRITVLDGEVIAACERFAPFVEGDGTSTISELIDQENKIRKEMKLFPVMHPLLKNNQTIKYLKKQKHSLSSVPKKGQRVKLFHRIALSPGGTVHTIPIDTITKKNKILFQQILQLFGARIFGIDVIMEKGVDVDWNQQQCIFLEVNSRPYMKLHEYPRQGRKPDLSKYYEHLNNLDIPDAEIL